MGVDEETGHPKGKVSITLFSLVVSTKLRNAGHYQVRVKVEVVESVRIYHVFLSRLS